VGVAISPEQRAQRHESRAAATYQRFLDELIADTGWSTEEADRRATAVIGALAEQLPPREAHGMFAQLPSRLRERASPEPSAEPIPSPSAEAFLGLVAARIDADPDEVDAIVRMVFRAVRMHLSTGEAHAVEACLPDDLRRLWNPPAFGRR
jgi:uncharacterized protein (DUF2267 family)